MKKYLFPILAVFTILAISCKKPVEVLETITNDPSVDDTTPGEAIPEFTPMVIVGVYDDSITKTEYTDEGTYYSFTWNAGDYVAVQLYKGGNSAKPDQIKFTAESTASTTNLIQDGTTYDLTAGHTVDGYSNKNYTLGDYAFYPKYANDSNNDLRYSRNSSGSGDGDSSTDYVTLFSSAPYISAKPTSIIPLIGKKTSGDGTPTAVYDFKSVTGVLKLTINNIPTGATKLIVSATKATDVVNGKNVFAGNWSFSDASYTDGLTMSTCSSSPINSKTITFSGLDGTNCDFYIPVPAGTIEGLNIEIQDNSGRRLYYVTTSSDIVISRAIIKSLTAITCKSATISVGNTSAAPTLYYNQNIGKIYVGVTTSDSNTLSAYQDGLTFSYLNEDREYDLTTFNSGGLFTSSGLYYLHYAVLSVSVEHSEFITMDLSDKRIKTHGTIPFYYLSSSDNTKINHQFAIQGDWSAQAINTSVDGDYHPGSSNLAVCPRTFTLKPSNDVSKGSIMLTEFVGRSCFIDETIYAVRGNQSSTGTPLYGTISGETISINSDTTNALWPTSDNYFVGGFATQNNVNSSEEEIQNLSAVLSVDETHYIVTFSTPYIHLMYYRSSAYNTFACLHSVVGKFAK